MHLNRWRCIRCETLNNSSYESCIVCGLEKREEIDEHLNRWRCIRCETLNDSSYESCIVCNLEKREEIDELSKKKCAYSGCKNIAIENQDYCGYHYHALCLECKTELKVFGKDYCINCEKIITKRLTKKLRNINLIFKIVDGAAIITFLTFLLSYVFYFN